jgi:hypothetical protein
MAAFLKFPTFDIYDEETGKWADADQWWLDGQLVYQSDVIGEDGKPILVEVPDKYPTDLASIPRFPPLFRTLFLKNGRHRPAAVPHDFLCRGSYVDDHEDPLLAFPRRLADLIFLEAMELVGVSRWKRYPMYWAVRANTERLILIGKARKTRKPDK